ncbi:hypothetical protein G7Y89_g4774 [Cudoniella acicularis]|uniref:Cytochrome P450 n=1 Tax=Cudoniella acicularis TaxID=354080 RepID=A0A8H4W6C3_9HELO|nr:hypothetical protein G7Y89_g4774 [Cudoniella acicularis]
MRISDVLTGLGILFAVYAICSYVSSILDARGRAKRALELNCEDPPPRKPSSSQLTAFGAWCTAEVGAITYKYSVFGSTNVVTSDEKNIQAVLAIQFNDFELGPLRRACFWPLMGSGIFTQDGKAWEHSQAMMRPQFVRDQVSNLDLEEKHVQNMMKALDIRMQNNHIASVDLQVLFRLTLDTATEFLFGKSVNMDIRVQTQKSTALWPKGFRESCKVCHEYIDQIVNRALSQDQRQTVSEKDSMGGKDKYVFLDALITQTQDPTELRSQLLNILLAGRDTAASLLSPFLCLSLDPVRYKKLRSLVVEEFGTYDNPSEITFEKLKGFNDRYANKDTTLPRGGGKDGRSKIFI